MSNLIIIEDKSSEKPKSKLYILAKALMRGENLRTRVFLYAWTLPRGENFDIYSAAEDLNEYPHNIYNAIHASGTYKHQFKMFESPFRILIREYVYQGDRKKVLYSFNEKLRVELAPLVD